ncbi:MAG TPA: PspC domain-containing protein [candidate division Zixibacteria bacterium]|nr:PspC domain-containing protein [candidate division Zixibacteria bacterium]
MTDQKPRKLYRSRSDRMLAGVCGGLAAYFNLDSTVVRLIFAIGVFVGLLTLIVYVVCWVLVPEEPQ